jgi:hypothetical protein
VTVLLVDPEEDADVELAEDLVLHLGRHWLAHQDASDPARTRDPFGL